MSPALLGDKQIIRVKSALMRKNETVSKICFNYIHQNPVKANLVKNEVDWEFSSAIDYFGLRNGKLINKEVVREYVEVV